MSLNQLVQSVEKARILLIGDTMLDFFVYGNVSRISPEGPVPVLRVQKRREMLGGAGNVLANACALGAQCHIISVIGDDSAGQIIRQKVEEFSQDSSGLVIDTGRPTILKTRYLAQNQQLLRVDQEQTDDISKDIQDKILTSATEKIAYSDIVVLSDYGKGVLTPSLIQAVMTCAKEHQIPVIIDPKSKDFSRYAGASIITPNRKELGEAASMPVKTDQDIEKACHALIQQHGFETIYATRSEDGMSVISKNHAPIHIPTQTQEVYDVSGAGDTVVAMIAIMQAMQASAADTATLSNIAAGLVVAKVGTAKIDTNELIAAIDGQEQADHSIAPCLPADKAREHIEKWQAQGLKVGFTNGCFDILHYGHVNYLAVAKSKCDQLVIGLNHDQSIKILKGANRPVNDEKARAAVIGALSSVDLVVLFGANHEGDDNTPSALLQGLQPDIMMKGGDYTVDQLPEAKIVHAYGGHVEILPLYDGYSTTNIIQKTKED